MANQRSIIQMRYDSKNTRHYSIKMNLKTDADIVEMLAKQSSVQTYIKQLIRADIAAQTSEAPPGEEES